jgi:hypothetical protein
VLPLSSWFGCKISSCLLIKVQIVGLAVVFNVALIMEKREKCRISSAHLTKCIAQATPEMEALRCLPMEVPMLGKFVPV